jgi:hypothetical protein
MEEGKGSKKDMSQVIHLIWASILWLHETVNDFIDYVKWEE